MISLISGSIIDIQSNMIVIAQAGIGFECFTTQTDQYQLEQAVTFFTHMHWNQDQGPTLFGFQSQIEKQTFMMIISCSGIGPKMALSILEQTSAGSFLEMIVENDVKALSNLKGIGAKKAEQLCLSLQTKVKKLADKNPAIQTGSLGLWRDVEETLTSLNYSSNEIKQVISHIKQENSSPLSFDHILRKALTLLAQK
jgi:Holliday junction DNA helicase RuvA